MKIWIVTESTEATAELNPPLYKEREKEAMNIMYV